MEIIAWPWDLQHKSFEWWISGLMLDPLFFLISRLNIAFLLFILISRLIIRLRLRISYSKVSSSVLLVLLSSFYLDLKKHIYLFIVFKGNDDVIQLYLANSQQYLFKLDLNNNEEDLAVFNPKKDFLSICK